MARKKIETIINGKIAPYTLTDRGKANISMLVRQYSYELLFECIDIGVSTYFHYDQDGNLTGGVSQMSPFFGTYQRV